jgi:hypothetical protein
MSGFLFYLAALACVLVLVVLAIGVGGFGSRRREGREGARFANKLMRWRIIAQFVAIVLVMLTILAIQAGY